MASKRSFARRPRRLTVTRFSSLEDLIIELPTLTILTGAQATGKSLICKLTYFFQEVFEQILRSVQDDQTVTQFVKNEAQRFGEWFPNSAWGAGKFRIRYEVDGFWVEVNRVGGRGGLKGEVTIKLSDSLESLYEEFTEAFDKSRKQVSREDQLAYIRSEQNYRLRHDFYRVVSGHFGVSWTSSQTYIPASRAYFTTLGKAMSAFEHGQLLDPITKTFGRLYIALSERMRHGFPIGFAYARREGSSGARERNDRMAAIFGGKPKMERNDVVIESSDGRVIPLYALSSGQQELLPLWLCLDYFDSSIALGDSFAGANFLYIEEPEAHLFPDAQAGVLEILVSLLRKPESRSQTVLTTHSPYLLAKANNLLLAGKFGFRKREARQKAVGKVVPKSQWLLPNEVSCYGLSEGRAISLIGEDGLISTDYIDAVSQDIVDEFQSLYDVI